MVPFSFPQPLLKSRVMNKHSSTIEVWMPGVWRLKLGAYAHSCLPAFLILIMAPLSVFTLRLRVCGQSAFVHPWLRIMGSMVSIIDRHAG
jgi:hypothetical protein